MAEIYETKQLTERVILVGVSFMEGEDTEQSLNWKNWLIRPGPRRWDG